MNHSSSRRTPIDDAYGTCAETYAKLVIYPGQMHPAEVTQRLGIAPTDMLVAGEERVNRRGLRRTVRLNIWVLSSEGEVESRDLRRHLDWLLAEISAKREAVLACDARRASPCR